MAAPLTPRPPPDLVLYCEAFLTTYRTFITPEELIKKLQYRYPSPIATGAARATQSGPASGSGPQQGFLCQPPPSCQRAAGGVQCPGQAGRWQVVMGDSETIRIGALRAGTGRPHRDPASGTCSF